MTSDSAACCLWVRRSMTLAAAAAAAAKHQVQDPPRTSLTDPLLAVRPSSCPRLPDKALGRRHIGCVRLESSKPKVGHFQTSSLCRRHSPPGMSRAASDRRLRRPQAHMESDRVPGLDSLGDCPSSVRKWLGSERYSDGSVDGSWVIDEDRGAMG